MTCANVIIRMILSLTTNKLTNKVVGIEYTIDDTDKLITHGSRSEITAEKKRESNQFET